MIREFEQIIKHLVSHCGGKNPLTGIDIVRQFDPGETSSLADWRNLNAVFLILLCGASHPAFSAAKHFLNLEKKSDQIASPAAFFREGLAMIEKEWASLCQKDEHFRERLSQSAKWMEDHGEADHMEAVNRVWSVFFPEGVSLFHKREEKILALRQKRTVRISALNPHPIQDPAKEMLFTANVLLTMPPSSLGIEELFVSDILKSRIQRLKKESQRYYYDHPIQIGVAPAFNEAVYGLKNLDRAVAFEKKRGTVKSDQKLCCVLSVSVTHKGLDPIARPYLNEALREVSGIHHLRVFTFTESDTTRLVEEILAPAAQHYLNSSETRGLKKIIGVDGEYGRHYSFLKAISAFWQVFLDPNIRATFKIDLDQVFPQEELVAQTGASALEHFKTPLWGAKGRDRSGEAVDLGLIAGSLVNATDIAHSLFTPDVSFPGDALEGDEWVFLSRLPQALSTEAEMMTRYNDETLNGRSHCLHRLHVTGGTCGILVNRLRRYRPFTPGFMGRAEDQAYLLSVLFNESGEHLRYVHKDGLIMRHDKETFASEAIKTAHMGKLVGDYARILLFSYYAGALPWSVERIKKVMDPFTGCFMSLFPVTLACLRLALKAASLFNKDQNKEACQLLELGTSRLHKLIKEHPKASNSLKEQYFEEKKAWDVYYDILDRMEKALGEGDSFALAMMVKAEKLIRGCEIDL